MGIMQDVASSGISLQITATKNGTWVVRLGHPDETSFTETTAANWDEVEAWLAAAITIRYPGSAFAHQRPLRTHWPRPRLRLIKGGEPE